MNDLSRQQADLLDEVYQFFVRSGDFNGVPLSSLRLGKNDSEKALRDEVGQLVERGLITLMFASHASNPHIKRVPDLLGREFEERAPRCS